MTPFSSKVAKEIFEVFPKWKMCSHEERTEDGKTFLFINISAPELADTEHGLTVSTYGDEVTVSFDAFHSHFLSWQVSGADFEHEAALPFVRSVLAEEVAVVSWWNGSKCFGASLVRKGESLDMSDVSGYNCIHVRSWNGSFNEDRAV
jgi:hypothetical protein